MAEYVKIRKSKNLRFRLISLMYLIFLILAAIQIPVGWLRVSLSIQKYLPYPSQLSDSILVEASNTINRIDNEFKLAVHFNERTGHFPEPNSYSITDKFFINGPAGLELFDLLAKLKNWSSSLSVSDPRKARFNTLFSDDLKHGLEKEKETKWIKYRWNHVPAGLARNLLTELSLRVHLLNTGSGNDLFKTIEEPRFSLMTGYSYLRVGDEATLSTRGDSLIEVVIEKDGELNEDYSISGNRIRFSPSVAGLYKIAVKGMVKEETLNIQVLPAGFPKKESLPLRICYTGIQYIQTIDLAETGLRVTCSADPEAKLLPDGKLDFRPRREGWCNIRIENTEGTLFYDSVFVKPIPDPFFTVKGIPSLSISRKQFGQLGAMEVVATHPSFKDEAYTIESMRLRRVGSGTQEETLIGNQIPVDATGLSEVQYLIITKMEVRAGLEKKSYEQPLIIQIK